MSTSHDPDAPDTGETSLTAATKRVRERMREYLGDTLDRFDAVARDVGSRTFSAPEVGDPAPDFVLPDARGGRVALSELVAAGPVVLVFYRGAWCPYCNLQLQAYQRAWGQFEDAGATLVAISPETPDNSLSTQEQNALAFPVLSDTGSHVAERYGLVFTLDDIARDVHQEVGIDLAQRNGDDTWRLPAAATFVVSTDGRIAYASVSADYRWRVGADEVLTVLRNMPSP
jgi:peroxiredoxin